MAHAIDCGNPTCSFCYPHVNTGDPDVDVLAALNADDYRIGDLQVIPYGSKEKYYEDCFPENFISVLYQWMKEDHVLPRTFCGMTNLTHDAIVGYLLNHRPLLIPGIWQTDAPGDPPRFMPYGMSWVTTWIGVPPSAPGPRSALAAYTFFRRAWGQPEAEVLGMLGLARLFYTYKLHNIYGERSVTNALTAKFMNKYGTRDLGIVPEFLLERRNGTLVFTDCVISMLSRKDFTLYVEKQFASLA